MPGPQTDFPPLKAVCNHCHTLLTLPANMAGTSGPCPRCQTWLDASIFQATGSGTDVMQQTEATSAESEKRKHLSSSGKGVLKADSFIDFEHLERRELHATLKVLAISLAIGAIIFLVSLYILK